MPQEHVCTPDFPADLLDPAPLGPLQECQSHLGHEALLQTACQRLLHGLQAACKDDKLFCISVTPVCLYPLCELTP